MPADPAAVKSLFLEAAAFDDPLVRSALLDERCGEDAALRARINALLIANDLAVANEGTASFVGADGRGAGEPTADFAGKDERVGAVLGGKYKLVEEIGEGGMGVVYMAQQTEPVKRCVAVKVVKAGMDSKAVLARFEAERQALAMMDHPNIARVLDAGTTDGGRPFFVMELVKGLAITEYCDERKLTARQRLELFVPVCQAIQHAHQKGVIHRDIKPSNVLVAMYDDRPVPKVIDFGVAKAAGQTLTEKTLMTGFGTVVGTPEYMSPEQANLNNLDIDTRSDVYSLGVLLYELLTGTTPVDRKSLGKAALLEVLRIVREVEAPRPSSKLSTIDTLPSVAANRGTEPAKLSKLLHGELDCVVLKALEKDRTRRYETANGLARDIQRYLADEVVEARPPSAGYRLKKMLRRNKGQVIAVSLILFALLAGITGTTAGLVEAKRQEQIARDEASEKEKARAAEAHRAEGERQAKVDAEAKRAEAQHQKIRAEEGEKLASVRLVLVDAEKKKVEAEKRIAEAAHDFLQNKLLGQADATRQADALLLAGESLEDAKENPTIRELLDRAAKELTPDKIDGNFPNQPLVQAAILRTVGYAYRGVGEQERSIGFLERSVTLYRQHLGIEHRDTLNGMHNLARAYWMTGKPDLAVPLSEETLKLYKARLGPDHSQTLASMICLAMAYKAAGKLELALPLLEEAHKLNKAKLGLEHLSTIASMNNLGAAYLATGKVDLAVPLFEEALKLVKAKLGPEHPSTLANMGNLAQAYQKAGKLDLALPLFEEALKLRKAKLGPDHPHTLNNMSNLAQGYQKAGRLDLALLLFEDVLKLQKTKLGPDHPHTLISMSWLAQAYRDTGKLDLALPVFEEAFKLRKAKLGPDHPHTLKNMSNLANVYDEIKQFDRSELLYRERLRLEKMKSGEDSPDYANAMTALCQNLLNQKKCLDAEPLIRKCLAILEKKQPDVWSTFNAKSMLGRALLDQQKYAEAEPLLLAGYEGMKQREKSIPRQFKIYLPEVVERLIDLYTAMGKPEELKKWQTERARYSLVVAPTPREKK